MWGDSRAGQSRGRASFRGLRVRVKDASSGRLIVARRSSRSRDRTTRSGAGEEAALAGATEAELDARPADGGWNAREVAHHIADSEITSAIRLRRLIAEEEPAILGYDGDEFARRLSYGSRPVAGAVAANRCGP